MPAKSKRNWHQTPLRAYEPGKRHMELIPSVSRSSGLDRDGDALREYKVQEEYRQFIEEKLTAYLERFPHGRSTGDNKQRDEVQANLLILFRKLREGLLSTKRQDEFALEVYETSMYLSIIFNSPQQTTSIISHILPVYRSSANNTHSPMTMAVLSSLHFLVAGYPSQSHYFQHLHSLPAAFLPADSSSSLWLRQVTHALRSRNYARFERLTERAAFEQALPHGRPRNTEHSDSAGPRSRPDIDLRHVALCRLVENLRMKTRDNNWLVLRSAYREWTLPITEGVTPGSTREWLVRSLALRPVSVDPQGTSIDVIRALDDWIERRHALGDVQPKNGVAGRWIVNKPKV